MSWYNATPIFTDQLHGNSSVHVLCLGNTVAWHTVENVSHMFQQLIDNDEEKVLIHLFEGDWSNVLSVKLNMGNQIDKTHFLVCMQHWKKT